MFDSGQNSPNILCKDSSILSFQVSTVIFILDICFKKEGKYIKLTTKQIFGAEHLFVSANSTLFTNQNVVKSKFY